MTNQRINDEKLLAFAAGELEGTEAQQVQAFIADHPEAAATVTLYRLAKTRRRLDDTVAPSATAVERAKAVFSQRTATAPAGWLDRLTEIVARVVYDSRLQPAAVRYTDTGSRFQLSFETDAADVDLQAERLTAGDDAPERWRLIGQLSADPEPGVVEARAETAGGGEVVGTARSDERSIFTLDLAPGTYDIRIVLADAEIVLPNIEVR
ncbi:MAG: anti-sigma factor [Planctomycetota bacterium]|jgi:anti-sigma factor RsiW